MPQWFQTSANPSARRPEHRDHLGQRQVTGDPGKVFVGCDADVAEELGGPLLGRPVANAHRVDARVAEGQ